MHRRTFSPSLSFHPELHTSYYGAGSKCQKWSYVMSGGDVSGVRMSGLSIEWHADIQCNETISILSTHVQHKVDKLRFDDQWWAQGSINRQCISDLVTLVSIL